MDQCWEKALYRQENILFFSCYYANRVFVKILVD